VFCFFAHHRSASSSSNDILRELARTLGWRHCTVHDPEMSEDALAAVCRARAPDLLTLSNARREYIDALPAFRGVHLIRDPRDVLVSSYFSHRESHPANDWPMLPQHRANLQAVDEEAGLLLEMDCRAGQFAALGDWRYDAPHILEWKMENLVQDTEAHFRQLLPFWGISLKTRAARHEKLRAAFNRAVAAVEYRTAVLKLPRWRSACLSQAALQAALGKHSFKSKTAGREPGEEQGNHHYRLGVSGGWRQHFTPEIKRQFRLRFGSLLIELGYETGDNW
tara:strand:+ start:13327 stop:14166 length:840 start_codon:yes stop_codon:yes gene_type:complete